MGFLSGVLKDVSEKQPYSVGKPNLCILIEKLEKHLFSGHNGFTKVIDLVSQCVTVYNKAVRESNDKIKNVVGTMQNNVTHLKNEVSDLNENNAAQDPDVSKAVHKTTQLVGLSVDYGTTFDNSIKRTQSNIRDLNSLLHTKIVHVAKIVANESDWLSRSSSNAKKDLISMIDGITWVLADLRKNINEQIKDQVAGLVGGMRDRVAEILIQLRNIEKTLIDHTGELNAWTTKTKWFIDEAKKTYVDKIRAEVRDEYPNKTNNIKRIADELRAKGEELYSYLYSTKDNVNRLVAEAALKVTALEAAVQYDLFFVKQDIQTRCTQYVTKFIEAVQQKVETIKGEEGLEGIRRRITEKYAQAYKAFESVVQRWIRDILDNNVLFRAHFDTYVNRNRHVRFKKEHVASRSNVNELIDTANVALEITNHLKTEAGIAMKNADIIPPHDKGNVQENIAAVYCSINEFARHLAKQLTREGNMSLETGTFVSGMVDVIESILMDKSTVPYTNKSYLESAIKSMLIDLASKAKETADELRSFTGEGEGMNTNIGENVDAARGVADDMLKKLSDAISNDPRTIGTQVYDPESQSNPDLADNIAKTIEEILDKQLPKLNGRGKGSHVDLKKLRTAFNKGRSESDAKTDLQRAIDKVNTAVTAMFDKHVKNIYVNRQVVRGIGQHDEGALQKLSTEITSNLDVLTQAILDMTGNLISHLTHLKDIKIDTNLNEIRDKIAKLRKGHLAAAINNTEAFLTFAENEKSKTIDALTYFVNRRIEKSTSTLTTLARKQYVTSIKHLLTAFADKVSQELEGLPAEIDEDLRIGFKGLMRKVQGEFENDNLNDANIQKLINEKGNSDVSKLSGAFMAYFGSLKEYLKSDIERVHNEEKKKKNPEPEGSETIYTNKLLDVTLSLNALLVHSKNENRYDHNLHGLLDRLTTAVTDLKPHNFDKPNSPVLDGVAEGLGKFVDELRKVYISVYDSQRFEGDLVEGKYEISLSKNDPIIKLTTHGKNCANVFLTILEVLSNNFFKLIKKCTNDWLGKQINTYEDNAFGKWFEEQGYAVNSEKDKQHGELQDRTQMNGTKIYDAFLNNNIGASIKLDTLTSWKTEMIEQNNATNKNAHQINVVDVLQYLYGQTKTYYEVCHSRHIERPTSPSSVYEMLVWLTGLPHNPVYSNLSVNDFGDLFEAPKEAESEDSDITIKDENDELLEAYPEPVTAPKLRDTLRHVCTYAENMLIAILGHGDADGMYACEFNTNPYGFDYPTAPGKCLDILVEVLLRVHHQLYLLFMRCKRTRETMSWRDCWYGKGIGGSDWQCNTTQCANQICPQIAGQSANQNANQNGKQRCDQHPKCGIKSPLQSFLEDGLPGFLPHPYSKADCKLSCSAPNHLGKPCKTPMGFGDICVTASHTSKGERIMKVLRKFCGEANKPLSRICSYLLCILQRPPQTLDEMFTFYYNFIYAWGDLINRQHKSDPFNKAVNDASFNRKYTLDFTGLVSSSGHGKNHESGDLFTLVSCNATTSPVSPCGSYLHPLSMHIRRMYSKEHADKYFSWMVYITETFYNLLKQLYDDCNGNCGGGQAKCRTSRCPQICPVGKTSTGANHDTSCNSIVNCKFTRPTMYKYGFVHEDALMLADKPTKRTCKDFCKALKTVLSDKVADNAALAKLVFKTIPEFLFKIRAPFIWLNVALWLLSLLYLIHIMVIRLDLLHIKSHLHSPSSHRIAAQSLLAAGRVNKLNRVFYLQP